MSQIPPKSQRRRPLAHYVALAALFAMALTYQVRFAKYRLPGWFGHPNVVSLPFLVGLGTWETWEGLSISFVSPDAKAAGLREGDMLLTVDGKPLTGTKVYGQAIAHAEPGDTLTVTVRPKGASSDSAARTVSFKLQGSHGPQGLSDLAVMITLWIVMPMFSVLLGFWVAAVRPRDPLAWLLLGLMLSFSGLSTPFAESWGPGLRELGTIYNQGFGNLLAVWLLLFGIYFPGAVCGPLAAPLVGLVQMDFGAPLAVGAVAGVIASIGEMDNYASVAPLSRWLARSGTLTSVLAYGAVSTFFACLWAKSSMAISRDAKRRLRLVYAGACISFTPLLVLVIIAQLIHHVEIEQYFPEWLSLTAFLLLFLFPLTLAYVIVVRKAMNVSVAIRQGLQYALARGGVRVLRAGISIALITAVVEFLQHSRTNPLRLFTVIGFAVVISIRLRALGDRLRAWTDRRFFRDAYNAEQILADLSEKVRGMVETRPLLETISERIAASLHVPHLAVLLDGSGPYRPAYAVGYSPCPEVVFAEDGGTVRRLREEQEPARVYLDDPDSWVYRSPGVSEAERAHLAELKAELLLPLAAREKLLGFISLSQKRSEEPYSGADVRLLKSVAAQAGLALENSRLTAAIADEVAQREKLNREVEIAREVQERLFPQTLPPIDGLDYFGKCRPALGVGGDYYDFLALPGGRLGIALGDVSGKGIAAALMMASLEASLRAEAMRGTDDLAAVIQNVNHLVYDATAENRYATFFYAQYDPATRRLSYVNAGHNPPMLFRKRDGECRVERLEAGGTVIGLLPQYPFEQSGVELSPGDRLVIYTDGVSEAMNHGEEEWGEARMMATAKQCDGLGAAETIERVIQAADEFAAGAKQHDDMTLVVLRVLESVAARGSHGQRFPDRGLSGG